MNFALMARRTLLTASVGLLLSGCIMVPTPEHGQLGPREPIKRDVVEWLRESKPTREEVLFALGGPETHTLEGGRCIYTWARVGGYWATGGGYSGAGGTIESRHFLLITFDENDRVESVEEPDRTLFSGFKSWNTDEGNLLKGPSQSGESIGWREPDPADGVDAVRFRSHAEWWANSEGNSPRQFWRGDTGMSGYLTLTDRMIHFAPPSHWMNDEQNQTFAYAELTDCSLRKFGGVHFLAIRTHAGQVHAFSLFRPSRWNSWGDFGLVNSKEHESVLAFIRTRIAEQGGTHAE